MANLQFGIKITADGKQATAELGQVNSALGKTDAAGKKAASGLSAMETGLKGLGTAASLAKGMLAGLAGALTVGEYIRAADAFTNVASRIKLVTGTAREYQQAMADSVAAAQRYGMALDDVGKLYARLAPIAQQLGRSQSDLNAVMTGIGASLKVSGATAAEASSTITQLTQALASGNVQWEDFGQLLDTNPALVRAVERELKPLVAQYGSLKEAISKGKVSNDELFNALSRSSAAFREQADTMNSTVGNAWTRLKNSLELATGKIDGIIGASKALGGVLDWLSKTVDTTAEAFRRFFNATDAEKLQDQIAKLDASLTDMANRPRWLINENEYDEKSALLQKLKDQLAELNRATLGAEQAAKPAFDGVKKSIEATGEAAKEAAKHLTKLQEAQNRGAGIIATGSKYIGMGESSQTAVLTKFLNEYSGTTAKSIAGTVNAWCARFVSAVLGEAKIGGLSTMSAKAYAGYGQAVWKQGMSAASLSEVMPGDIAIFTRKGGGGHVGFVKATDPGKGLLDILGGNQSNQVSIVQRSLKDLVAIRRVTGDSLKDFESAEQAIEKEKSAYEKAMAAKKKAADEAFNSLKLHQDDAIKRAEDYAHIQVAKIKTSMAALKAEEEAQQRVTAAEIASARTVDEKQTLIAQAAQQSAAFHASEQSLVMAEIAQQQKLLEAKRAALTNELKGAQSGQYAQDESQQLAIKQAIRAVDTDLAQLAETRRQAEISTGAAVNEYGQQSLAMKAQEYGFIQDTIAAYQREVEVLNRLTQAKAAGASKEQLVMLNQHYQQTGQLPDVVSAEQLKRVEQYKLSTLAVGEAIKSLTGDMKDLKTPEQAVADEQLRMNKVWEDATQRMVEYAQSFEKAFGKMGKAVAGSAAALAIYEKRLRDISVRKKAALEAAGTDVAKQEQAANEANLETLMNTFDTLGNIAAAMQNMFEEGTAGYRAMAIAQQVAAMATQAANIALGIQAVMQQLANGEVYSAIPRALAVAGMVAGLVGSVISISGGGGGATGPTKDSRQADAGTGTVLGDFGAKSESIANSLEIIRNNSSNDLNYSAKMLKALEGIEAAVSGTTTSLFLFVNKTLAQLKIPQGQLKNNKDLADWGIAFPAKEFLKIIKGGLDEGSLYAQNVRNKTTTNYVADISDFGLSKQFTKVLRGMKDALVEGGKAFGLSADDFNKRIRGFIADLGTMSFKDMTGEEVQKQISAIMSNLSDKLAVKFMPGLEAFQKVGEGYSETFWRMAEGINRAKGELEQLGMKAIDYTQIIDTQGDVAAEMARQTIMEQGHLAAGVNDYVNELTGSAEDIIDAYKKLVDASNLMKTGGFGDANLDRTMINAAGGLESFVSLMQSFKDSFLTEAQRFAGDSATLADQFAALNRTMPDSQKGFYDLMHSIDTTTESGKKLFGALLKLNPAFAELANRVQGIKDKYADVLNPFGKIGAQIDTVIGDFNILISDAAARSKSTLGTLENQLKDALKPSQAGYAEAAAMRTRLNKSLNDRYKALHEAQTAFDAEMAKPEKKRNGKKISQWLTIIRESKEAINDLTAGLNSVWDEMGRWQDQINQLNADYAGKTGVEKARADMEKAAIVADANTVMTDTLAKIFEELAATVEQARQKIDAVKQLQNGLQTQIAQLQGPAATRDLMTARSTEAMGAIDAYIARLSTGMKRNTDTEIQLIQTAQQAVMNKYNAELAAVQALESNIQSLTSYLTGLATQIAQLQGPQAVAGLAGQRYTEARQAIGGYIRGVRAGDTRDYAKETQLLQDGQAAVMERYNAEMALLQEAAQAQAQVLQDQMNAQIEAINAATQAQVDAINTRLEAEIEAINQAAEAAVKARQKEFDAANKAQQKANDEAIKAQQKGYDAANKAQQKAFDAETKARQKVFDKDLKAIQKAQEAKAKTLQDEYDAAVKLRDAIKGVADYARGMALSAASPLSPEQRLAESGKQYQELLGKAKGGDAESIARLSGASDAYLEAAKNYYGSSTQYADIFKGVQDAMTGVGAMNSADPDSIQSRIDALREAQSEELDRVRELQQDAMDLLREQQQERMDAIREQQQAALDATREAQQEAMEAMREAQQAQLDAMRDATQAQIKAAQDAAKAQIDAVQKGAQAQIEALQKDVAQRVKDLSDPDKNLAMKALKEATIADLKELQRLAEVSRKGAEEQAKAAEGKTDAFRTAAITELEKLSRLADSTQIEAQRQFAETQNLARDNAQRAADSAAAQLASLAEGNRLSAAQAAILNSIAGKMIEGFVPIEARAKGGFTPAGYTLVGEQGPELVRFTQPSMVYTAAETRQILAAPTTDKTEKHGLEKNKFATAQSATSIIERLTNNNQKTDAFTFIERDRQSSTDKLATLQSFSKILEKVPAFANGGMAQPGIALVGEQGPELVRFTLPAARIDPPGQAAPITLAPQITIAPQLVVTPPVVPKPAFTQRSESYIEHLRASDTTQSTIRQESVVSKAVARFTEQVKTLTDIKPFKSVERSSESIRNTAVESLRSSTTSAIISAKRMAGEPPNQATVLPFVRPANPGIKPAPQDATRTAGDEKSLKALEDIKAELKAIVATQSGANPKLIDKLAAIEERLNRMERNQKLGMTA